jgi:hypothetical protein
MKNKPKREGQVTDTIVLPKAMPPEKNGIDRTSPVNNYGAQKEMTVCEPGPHVLKLKHAGITSRKRL